MSKEVTVEELREKFDELLAAVENGEALTLTRDGKQIGTVNPSVARRGVLYPFRNLNLSPGIPGLGDEAVRQLIEERDRERSGKKHGL
jgi:antitoxin (DNA-binding transcriptional repressor) of toxin-antitoxin stability system